MGTCPLHSSLALAPRSDSPFPNGDLEVPRCLLLLILLCGILCAGCQRTAAPPRAGFVRSIPWAENGVWLKADTHVHTKYSDGGVELGEVVQQASDRGCNVLAITDHADHTLRATSDEYFEALEAARRQFPKMVLLAGLEWNVPPWQGREHATVLSPVTIRERQMLRDFQMQFDDFERGMSDSDGALFALRWLGTQALQKDDQPVVFYNHPSRKRATSAELAVELGRWCQDNSVAVGFEGGPGHQDSNPIGAYQQTVTTIDRWDPAAAVVGDAWDRMLQGGTMVWGALATSDFHNADPEQADDFWPGEFSETWLYAADRTPGAALSALRSGSFFGVHGHIARQVRLTASSAGLNRPAIAGESIYVPPGANVEVLLELQTPPADWKGQPNRVDEVELIVITHRDAAVKIHQPPAAAGPALRASFPVEPGGMVIRARGRRFVSGGPSLMFYTNPIQILSNEGPPSAGSAAPGQRRQMPAWIYLVFIAGCSVFLTLLDRWRIEIIRRFTRGDHSAVPQPETLPHVLQRHLLVALACVVFLAAYGSWVPFHRKPQTWPGAAAEFSAALQQPLRFSSKSDWATNVLLFVPVGFLMTGLALGRLSSDRRRAIVLPLVVLACVALSMAIEFGQTWLHDRFCSQDDLVAESLGGLLGASAWLVCGAFVAGWLHRFQADRRPRQQLERMLEVYLLAAFAMMILPLDLTLSPKEIYMKYKEGRINLLPFADLSWSMVGAVQLLEKTLFLLPLGVLMSLWRWPRDESVRPLGRSLLLGAGTLAVIEAAQFLVFRAHSSVTAPIIGLFGIAAGWGLARWRLAAPRLESSAARRQMSWAMFALATAYGLLLAVVFCWPRDPVGQAQAVEPDWQSLFSKPFLAMYQAGAIENVVEDLLRKLLLFSTAGALLAAAVRTYPPHSRGRWAAMVGAAALALLLTVGIEVVQVWVPSHTPDLSDVLLGMGYITIGFIAILMLAERDHTQPAQP